MPKYGYNSNGYKMNPYMEEEKRGIFSHAKSFWWDIQQYRMLGGAVSKTGFKSLGSGTGYEWKGIFGLKKLSNKYIKGEGKWANRVRGVLSGTTFMENFGVDKTALSEAERVIMRSTKGSLMKRRQPYKGVLNKQTKKIISDITTRMKRPEGLFETAKGAVSIGKDKKFVSGLATGKAGKSTAASILRKSRGVQLASKLGRGLTGFMWLSMMYDITSTITQAGVTGIGSIADWAEAKASRLSNNRMEFGGELPQGFYTSQTATERRRALETIRGGYGGRGFLGQEAKMMHS